MNFKGIGAQIFIEPGQTEAEIDNWFLILRENKLKFCRIRMFEKHIKQNNDTWDYSLYDFALNSAQKHNISVFITLFPDDPLSTFGGFKFPVSKDHQNNISTYIKNTVLRYKNHPALYGWVLMNEPGALRIPLDQSFTHKKYQKWLNSQSTSNYDNGYAKEPPLLEMFLRDYNTWYLNWISSEIRKHDTKTKLHANPYALFELLPQYNFSAYEDFLSSLGASIHPSWHFSKFSRNQYAFAVAVNNNLIKEGAGNNPYWVTELQGGNNIFSSNEPLCPTKEDIAQWLWTSIGSGSEGIIYWSLNPRGTGNEAGEWSLLTFQNKSTERLAMTSNVSKTIDEYKKLFENATSIKSPITIMYNQESIWLHDSLSVENDKYLLRQKGAIVNSMLSFGLALSERGVNASYIAMDNFDWNKENYSGQIIILSNTISFPSRHWNNIKLFVKNGGKLIVEGLSGYYDENKHCIMKTGFPLKDLFGAELSEFKFVSDNFNIKLTNPDIELNTHMQMGVLNIINAKAVATKNKEIIATRNNYGKGEVLWIPSLIGLWAWKKDNSALSKWLYSEVDKIVDGTHFKFKNQYHGILMQAMDSNKSIITVIVNMNNYPKVIELEFNHQLKGMVIFKTNNKSAINQSLIHLEANETIVAVWS